MWYQFAPQIKQAGSTPGAGVGSDPTVLANIAKHDKKFDTAAKIENI